MREVFDKNVTQEIIADRLIKLVLFGKAFKICNIIRFPPFSLCQNIVSKNIFMAKCSDLTEKCLESGDNDERHCK